MPTADELWFAPLRKIERAIHHINDLGKAIDAFLAEKPFKLMAHSKRRAGWVEFRPKTNKPIPPQLSLIIGDAIHNLASALDVTLYGMAKDRAPTPEKIMFPFTKGSTPEALEGAINNGQVKFAGTNVAQAVRLLKPYQGGHPILSGIHALDVRDKHHLLILTGHVASLTGFEVEKLLEGFKPRTTITGPGTLNFTTPQGQPILRISVRFVTRHMADSEKEANIQPAFNIAFGEGAAFRGRPGYPIAQQNGGRG
jgi:hypothetical protein